MVNGKIVNIPSYLVKEGDVIEIRESSRNIPMIIAAKDLAERDIPDYVSVNNYKATFLRTPKLSDVPYPVQMEPQLCVEFYSR